MPDADASPAPAQGKKKKKKGAAAESGTAEAEPEGPEQMWAPEQEEGYCLVVPIEEEGADPEDMMQLVQVLHGAQALHSDRFPFRIPAS